MQNLIKPIKVCIFDRVYQINMLRERLFLISSGGVSPQNSVMQNNCQFRSQFRFDKAAERRFRCRDPSCYNYKIVFAGIGISIIKIFTMGYSYWDKPQLPNCMT